MVSGNRASGPFEVSAPEGEQRDGGGNAGGARPARKVAAIRYVY